LVSENQGFKGRSRLTPGTLHKDCERGSACDRPAHLLPLRETRQILSLAVGRKRSAGTDFFETAKLLKSADISEKRQQIPPEFYALLDKSKRAFEGITATENEGGALRRGGGQDDACTLKRLKTKEIARYHGLHRR
jgi:hypothetical protein